MAPMKPVPHAEAGKIRIIGGRWRGTRLSVPASPGLRPSSDRARETLFNWLMPALPGARVVDAFAGTGALGLEAVSRGAVSAVLVERDAALAQALRATVARLSAQPSVEVVQSDALAWLARQAPASFDLAFVDPPFGAGLWQATLDVLLPTLAPDAWLYIESPPDQAPALPPQWSLHREGRTREVRFALYRAPDRRGADTLNGNISVAVPE
ncbi:16S rRNA m(2)G-966 methyltransferase [Pseudoxanthomonas sp. CF125]|nr:16S rRNA m(2)G-966 methyltransferase [Pseudoxanthomonas sp. CF125]